MRRASAVNTAEFEIPHCQEGATDVALPVLLQTFTESGISCC